VSFNHWETKNEYKITVFNHIDGGTPANKDVEVVAAINDRGRRSTEFAIWDGERFIGLVSGKELKHVEYWCYKPKGPGVDSWAMKAYNGTKG